MLLWLVLSYVGAAAAWAAFDDVQRTHFAHEQERFSKLLFTNIYMMEQTVKASQKSCEA
jgi:hypothetical protein